MARGVRDAIRNASHKGLSLGLERVCRLAVIVAAGHVLGSAAFGRFVFAATVTAFLALGAELGMGVWSTRALAREPGAERTAAIVRVGVKLRAAMAVPFAAVIGLIASRADSNTQTALVLLGVSSFAQSLGDHVGAVLRGRERFAMEARLNAARAVIATVAGGAALVFTPTLNGLSAAFAAGSSAGLVVAIGVLAAYHPLRRSGAPPTTRAGDAGEMAVARVALHEAVPIWLAGLLSLAYFKVDHVLMRWLAGDAALGAYGAAYKFFEGSMVVPAVVLAVVFPKLAYAHGSRDLQRTLERRVTTILLGLGAAAAVFYLLFGHWLVVTVFGHGFDEAVPSLRALAVGLPFLYVNYGLTHFLLARNLERSLLGLSVLMLGLVVGLDVAIIPRLSGAGAGAATALSEAALTLGCLTVLRRRSAPLLLPTPAPTEPRTDPGVA